ncbi:hypothetical protein HanPI659440_Chr07g0258851 [Helianthus annuus]|nr:hypothetical protein HanPI659440_Chr07g0258851 [Helianthus annuus]
MMMRLKISTKEVIVMDNQVAIYQTIGGELMQIFPRSLERVHFLMRRRPSLFLRFAPRPQERPVRLECAYWSLITMTS